MRKIDDILGCHAGLFRVLKVDCCRLDEVVQSMVDFHVFLL